MQHFLTSINIFDKCFKLITISVSFLKISFSLTFKLNFLTILFFVQKIKIHNFLSIFYFTTSSKILFSHFISKEHFYSETLIVVCRTGRLIWWIKRNHDHRLNFIFGNHSPVSILTKSDLVKIYTYYFMKNKVVNTLIEILCFKWWVMMSMLLVDRFITETTG